MTDVRSATPADPVDEQLVTIPAPPTVWPDPFPATAGSPPSLGHADLPAPPSGRLRRVFRGRPADPAWVRPALLGLLAGTAMLYLFGLGASGWANSFYSAAVQAGTKSWKAFFFGSFDASNFITVDKPPAALWIMVLSARVFGVNAWSILVPQALEGVATVGLLYLCVRRWFAPAAALLAGAVMALTPVATLMFRFNNPDALLTLLLTGAAYATIRAVEAGRTRWMLLAGSLIGFGFITKMLQALILLPVLALVYLLAGPRGLGRRILQVGGSGLAMLVSAGWWVAAVELTPAADRPYVGGSADNNLLNLVFGYNGFGRLTGNETGSVVPGGVRSAVGAASPWGPTGWDRLFLSEMGGQVAWLIPAALIATLTVLWFRRRAPRTDRVRAAFLLFAGWLILTGAVLSFAQGIIHPYYTVVLAPAIGALVGMGGWFLWTHRSQLLARVTIGGGLAVSVIWAFVLLDRSPQWYPALRWAIVLVGLAVATGIVLAPRIRGWRAAALAALALAALLAGPAAYSLDTAATPHSGAIPSAGPAIRQLASGPGGPGGLAGFGGGAGPNGSAGAGRFGGGSPGGGVPFGGTGAFPGASPGAFGGTGGLGNGGGGGRPSAGGLLNGSTPGKQLTALLEANASRYTWVAATTGADSASGYQLATGDAVMAIGGFNGTDPAPTLAQFERDVAEGKIHYYIEGGGGGGIGGNSASSDASQIVSWVSSHFTARTVDGITIYDLAT